VLFIDEIHTVVGAGATGGAMDASNLLKPMLARGELRCIGATTLDEHRQHIEKDPALERRFQQVFVDQPTVEDTISILRGLKERYEVHHGVRIADNALVAAAVLSSRYIADRFLPDKAIDLMDESAARLKMEITSKPEEIDELDRRILQLEMEKLSLGRESDAASRDRLERLEKELADLSEQQSALNAQWQKEKGSIDELGAIKEEIEQVQLQVEQAKRNYDLNKAAELEYGTLAGLNKKLAAREAELSAHTGEKNLLREEVTEDDIARLLRMEEELHKRVIGQEQAIKALSKSIRRTRAGLKDPKRPSGSFIFAGPSGVGKTELSKTLAEFLFGDDDALIALDMSEFSERHTASRLFGSPPGYVGYEEGGQLTEKVRRKPFSVVLFDEVEKAHPDIFNSLLQVLEEGRLTDAQGRVVDFKNTVIIMTTNLGSRDVSKGQSLGFAPDSDTEGAYEAMKAKVQQELKQHFRPEFLNRIDDVIVFHQLTETEIIEIVDLMAASLEHRLEEQDMGIEITDAAKALLAHRGYDSSLGARPLRRTIQRDIEDPLAEKLLFGDLNPGSIVVVDVATDDSEEPFTFTATPKVELPDVPPVEAAGAGEADAVS